jgi:F-type H+-transporting ATPase subunit delta
VDDVFNRHPQLEVLFSAAAVGRHVRQAAIEKAFTAKTSDTFVNFLLVLNEHERLDLLRAIRQAAHEINDERQRRLRVQVESAVPLPDPVRESLIERIRGAYHMEPVVEATIDPKLLGGFKVRVRDLQIDATLSTYLDNLRKHLLSRGSHEIQSRRDHFSSAT